MPEFAGTAAIRSIKKSSTQCAVLADAGEWYVHCTAEQQLDSGNECLSTMHGRQSMLNFAGCVQHRSL
jgi:hypothetical protein